ncbi:DUF5994 family protein [Nocardia sp. JMUB6875]|uniref:DUF5994 family protein n=1 Tax=Nocardia sp. JMUB6875 TaxID=3158170 RepID=UPI0034E87475
MIVASAPMPAAAQCPPRLLLRANDAGAGPIEGAWWPRTADPMTELHEVIEAIGPVLGQLVRVGFDWAAVGSAFDALGAYRDPGGCVGGIMHLLGSRGTRIALLVVAADTEPTLAATHMRWAAGQPLPND